MQANGVAEKQTTPANKNRKQGDDPMSALGEDLATVRTGLTSAVRHGSEVVTQQASSLVADAKEEAVDLAKRVSDSAGIVHKSVCGFASKRPMATIALAALGGAVLVGLLRRRA